MFEFSAGLDFFQKLFVFCLRFLRWLLLHFDLSGNSQGKLVSTLALHQIEISILLNNRLLISSICFFLSDTQSFGKYRFCLSSHNFATVVNFIYRKFSREFERNYVDRCV